MPIIRVDDLSKTYRLGEQDVTALEGVSLTVEKGVFMAIAGPSGVVNQHSLNIMGCIDAIRKGRVQIEGKDVSARARTILPMFARERSVSFFRPSIFFRCCPPSRTLSTRCFRCQSCRRRSEGRG